MVSVGLKEPTKTVKHSLVKHANSGPEGAIVMGRWGELQPWERVHVMEVSPWGEEQPLPSFCSLGRDAGG